MDELTTQGSIHERQRPSGGVKTMRRRILLIAPASKLQSRAGLQAELLARNVRHEGAVVAVSYSGVTGSDSSPFSINSLFKHAGAFPHTRELYRAIPRYDVVHVFHAPPLSFVESTVPALVLARFFNKRTILSFSSDNAEEMLERFGKLLAPVFKLPDRIVVGSEYLSGLFARYGIPSVVIPHGADLSEYHPRLIHSVQPRILTTRSVDPDHNLPSLIRCFKLVQAKYPRAELIIVGDGSERVRLENLIRSQRLTGITFVGARTRDQIRAHYQDADVYVNPSSSDDFPLSIIESLASGLPIVTTDAGGVTQVIRDRETGLVVPANDHNAMADRIIELIEAPELVTKLSANGMLQAQRFQWPNLRQRWLEEYRLPQMA